MTSVEEPKPGGGTYITNYTYTKFDELATVTMTRDGYNGHTAQQVTQTRTFEYEPSGSGRLTKTIFPDAGTTEYHFSGALLDWKKNPKGVWKYYYNSRNQIVQVEKYPGATSFPTQVAEDVQARVVYYYDSQTIQPNFTGLNTVGRLAALAYCGPSWAGCTKELFSYTAGGKLVKKRVETEIGFEPKAFEVSFEYDSEGKMQYMVYPSGKRVKYSYDQMRRHTGLREVMPDNTEQDLVTSLTYGVAEQLTGMSWKHSNGQWGSQGWTYNNRMQMTGYGYQTFGLGGSVQVSHTYNYSASNNDGKLVSRTDNLSGEQVQYLYDSIHRLSSATAQAWSQTYIYDGFGNMKQKLATGTAQYTAFNQPMSSATNNGGVAGSWADMDQRALIINGEQYSYAPDNKRINKKFLGSDGYEHVHFTMWLGSMRVGTYDYRRASAEESFVEWSVKEDLYVAGRRVAPSDRLGSDLSGGLKLMPYGEEIQPPNVPSDRTKFATYHRDNSGMDYADQRYYSPGQGRFATGDPYVASGGAGSPNSWNRFSYASNDPINRVDPEGLVDYVAGSEWMTTYYLWLQQMQSYVSMAVSARRFVEESSAGAEGLSGKERAEHFMT